MENERHLLKSTGDPNAEARIFTDDPVGYRSTTPCYILLEPGLICHVRMKKYRSYKGEVRKVAPNLLNRDFHSEKPNQKWATDVTEFSLFGEKLYLSPILDLYSSNLVSYTISEYPVLSMVTTMLDKVFEKIPDDTNPILHSDQG